MNRVAGKTEYSIYQLCKDIKTNASDSYLATGSKPLA